MDQIEKYLDCISVHVWYSHWPNEPDRNISRLHKSTRALVVLLTTWENRSSAVLVKKTLLITVLPSPSSWCVILCCSIKWTECMWWDFLLKIYNKLQLFDTCTKHTHTFLWLQNFWYFLLGEEWGGERVARGVLGKEGRKQKILVESINMFKLCEQSDFLCESTVRNKLLPSRQVVWLI